MQCLQQQPYEFALVPELNQQLVNLKKPFSKDSLLKLSNKVEPNAPTRQGSGTQLLLDMINKVVK